MPEASDRSSRALLLIAALATATLGIGLALGLPLGIPGEWVWRRNLLPVRLWPAAAAGLVLVTVTWFVCRPGRIRRGPGLVLLMLAVFALQCALLNAVGLPWITPGAIIASPVATTYYSVSLDVRDPVSWIASYPERMRSLPYHARTHPPGFVLLFLLLRRATAALVPHPPPLLAEVAEAYRQFGIAPSPADAAAAMAGAVMFALSGALGLWLFCLLAGLLVGGEAALCGAALMAAGPALLLFGASPDEMVLTASLVVLWLSYSAWRTGSVARAFIAGLAFAVGLFFSLGLVVLGAWLLVWMILGMVGSKERRGLARRCLVVGAAGAGGVAAFYLVLYLAVGYRPLAVAQEGLFAHRGVMTVQAARSYWKWVLMNPLETAIFAGLPLVIAAIFGLRDLRQDASLSRWRTFLLSWAIVFALLDISGTVRGEVGRIWLFLLWPFALIAGPWLASRPRRAGLIAAIVALQVWQTVLMRGYLTLYDIF